MYLRGIENLVANLNSESNILTETEPIAAIGEGADGANDKGKDKVVEAPPLQVPIPVLVTLYSISSSKTIGEYSLAEKIINIGCMKSSVSNDKKDAKKVQILIKIKMLIRII